MNIQWLTARPIAHRGLHDAQYPENSLGAFKAAVAAGYPLELDVHLTQDNELVVVHDENLKRVTGEEYLITSTPRETWRALRLCESEEGIPTFDEVLEAVDGKVGIVIEVKKDDCRKIGELEDRLIERLRRYQGDYVVKSFDPRVVGYIRRHAEEIFCGQLSYNYADEPGIKGFRRFLLQNLWFLPFNRAQFISYQDKSLPNVAVARYRRKGLPVLCWTIRSQEAADNVRGLVDNIIFENFIPEPFNK